jgi:hypothetical protein
MVFDEDMDGCLSSPRHATYLACLKNNNSRNFLECSHMNLDAVPFRSPLSAYEQRAESLLAGHRAADPAAIDLFHRKHPRFLDEKIKWLPKSIASSEIHDAALSLDDARLAIARYYDFLDWPSLAANVEAVSQDGPVLEFESAVEAVVNGDLAAIPR